MNIDDDKIQKMFESLQNKIESITSHDSLVTLYYNGVGDVKRIVINKELDEIDKVDLEHDIVMLIERAKQTISTGLFQSLLEKQDESNEETNGVDVDNVS